MTTQKKDKSGLFNNRDVQWIDYNIYKILTRVGTMVDQKKVLKQTGTLHDINLYCAFPTVT